MKKTMLPICAGIWMCVFVFLLLCKTIEGSHWGNGGAVSSDAFIDLCSCGRKEGKLNDVEMLTLANESSK